MATSALQTRRAQPSRPHTRPSSACRAVVSRSTAEPACTRRDALLALPSGTLLWQLVATASAGALHCATAAPAAVAAPAGASDAARAAALKAVEKTVTKTKAAVALRLAYHDAGTFSKRAGDGGMNASIRFELDRPENFGLKRGWRLVEEIQTALKGTPAEGVVSLADIIALAGAHAVALTGGPQMQVPIGRRDAEAADPEGRMASEKSDAATLKAGFAEKGFSVRELVALSGAHTLGSKGFGDPVTFDNAYYVSLLKKPWLDTKDPMSTHIGLPSDHVLPEDAECLPIIQQYAGDQDAFFNDFAAAYVKLCSTGAVWA